MNQRSILVYMAGPVTGRTYDGCNEWRERVRHALRHHEQVVTISPLRAKEYLRKEACIKASYESVSPLSTAKGILARDFWDVKRCDILFANLQGAVVASIGTVSEIAWAFAMQKPVILVMDEGNIHDHPFIREASGFILPTLDQAIDVLMAMCVGRPEGEECMYA